MNSLKNIFENLTVHKPLNSSAEQCTVYVQFALNLIWKTVWLTWSCMQFLIFKKRESNSWMFSVLTQDIEI